MIDASVAAKWYLRDEELLVEADWFKASSLDGAITAISPYLSRYELASALLIAHRAGRISREKMETNIVNYSLFDFVLNDDPVPLLVAGAELLRAYRIGYYDGVYLALTQEFGGRLVTADDRFYQRAREHFPYVVWLGDVPV